MYVFKLLILVLLLQSFNVYAENEADQSACLKEAGVIRCFNEYRKKVEDKSSRLAWYFSRSAIEYWAHLISGDRTAPDLIDSLRVVRSRSTFTRRMCEIHDMRYDAQTDSSGRLHILSSSCSNGDYRMTIVDYKKENGRWVISLVTHDTDRNICWKPPFNTPRICDAELVKKGRDKKSDKRR